MNKGKLAAVVMAVLAVAMAVALLTFITVARSKRVEDLIGQPHSTVREKLGDPARQWPAESFACDPKFACVAENARGGPVWMYTNGEQAVYLYFDAGGTLQLTEPVRPKGQPKPPR